MKKAIILAVVFMFLAATSAMASIIESRHNLGYTGDYTYHTTQGAGGTSEICIFCHTPHNAVQNYPLWNRSNPVGASFQFYSSENAQMTGVQNRQFTADSISLFCMSCHDGATGLFSAVVRQFGETGLGLPGDGTLGGYAAIGGDTESLKNDHPVNFRYNTAKAAAAGDTFFHTINDVTVVGGLKLFNEYVECASCHDPHNISYGKFLRKSNESSKLCLTCHDK